MMKVEGADEVEDGDEWASKKKCSSNEKPRKKARMRKL
jgi:hypothetical protein